MPLPSFWLPLDCLYTQNVTKDLAMICKLPWQALPSGPRLTLRLLSYGLDIFSLLSSHTGHLYVSWLAMQALISGSLQRRILLHPEVYSFISLKVFSDVTSKDISLFFSLSLHLSINQSINQYLPLEYKICAGKYFVFIPLYIPKL